MARWGPVKVGHPPALVRLRLRDVADQHFYKAGQITAVDSTLDFPKP